MKISGLCNICGRPAAMFTCMLCGKIVCKNCYENRHNICINCKF